VKAYGCNPSTIRDWLLKKPKEFYYLTERKIGKIHFKKKVEK